MDQSINKWLKIALIAASISFIAGCTGKGIFNTKLFKERTAETPVPHEEGIEKAFFREADGTYKTFLCAWSPEIGRGFIGEMFLTRLVNEAMHCNIVFEVTEDYLVGKSVNPSFLEGDEKITQKHVDQFKEILKFPISKHYYFERAKDAHGRETNEWIENDSRSHYTARPFIKLNLAGVSVLEFMGSEFGAGASVSSIEDVEWDKTQGFLGFSANMTFSTPRRFARDEYQGQIRFNFLKFDHDGTFIKTPYAQENSRFMNILHVMGHRVEGLEQVLYAAHWDIRKPQKLYISGAPKHIQPIIFKAIDRWNEALREIGAIPKGAKAFYGEVREAKHAFDLRYPTINWIQDKRISLYSPLGIGMAHADIRNGKILWGSVVMYGGLLENYINRYAPVEGAAGAAAMGISPLSPFAEIFPENMEMMSTVKGVNDSFRSTLIQNMTTHNVKSMEAELVRARQNHEHDPAEMAKLQEQLNMIKANDPNLEKIVSDLIAQGKAEGIDVANYFRQNNLRKKYGRQDMTDAEAHAALSERNPELAETLADPDSSRRMSRMGTLSTQGSPFFVETDRNIVNMAPQWMASAAQQNRTLPEMLESVVMDLTLHEIGHMIGLGHQFKENIVPEHGTVPNKYVAELSKKATAKEQFTNYTSVMGYRSGHVEMALPEDEIHPGPHDKLVLRYLYRRQYTAYDKRGDGWVYPAVPESGKIPHYSRVKDLKGTIANLPTSYFPQCNDWEASLDADPFCNRWDRGSKAEDIVASYFSMISDNLLSTLYSVVGGGSNQWAHESRLWSTALDTFARVRLFYDEMRRRLRSDERFISDWDALRGNKEALFEFSQACQKPSPTDENQVNSPVLRRLFAHKDLVDLCRANALALKEFRFFFNLPEGDYTRMDHTQRYISGGYLEGDVRRNYGNMLGSWFQLSNFPLKFTAMYALTTADPFFFDGWWLWPNMYYDHEENRVLYRTLYPREYTKAVSDAVLNNMRFAATGMAKSTNIGKTILATSWFLPWQRWTSNDSARLPREYNTMLDQQTQFSMSMVAVLISAMKPEANSNTKADHYKKFTASVYDFFTGKSSTAREVFVLPRGDVIVWANGMFLYPITKMKFYNESSSYVIAYKISFDLQDGDELYEDSVKAALLEKHSEIAENCIVGFNRNGLANYFTDSQRDFEGFYIPPGIADEIGVEKTGLFYDSIDKAYDKYHAYSAPNIPPQFPLQDMRSVCDESLRGIGQISASAALVNGYWLRTTPEYLEK